jgi:hypothetical protein
MCNPLDFKGGRLESANMRFLREMSGYRLIEQRRNEDMHERNHKSLT